MRLYQSGMRLQIFEFSRNLAANRLHFAGLRSSKARVGTEMEMAVDSEELVPKKKRPAIVLGEDMSEMSAPELEARIAELDVEITRCREAIAARNATKAAAANFFKR